jgi:hypothetical protein
VPRAVRIIWILLVASICALAIAGIPVTWDFLRRPCAGGSACLGWGLTAAGIDNLHRVGLSPDFFAACMIGNNLVSSAIWITLASIIIWRAPRGRMALVTPFVLLLFSASAQVGVLATFAHLDSQWSGPIRVFQVAGAALLVPFLYTFPDGRFLPRWTVWLCLAGVAAEVEQSLTVMGVWQQTPPAQAGALALLGISLASVPVVQTYRYRRLYNAVQRQQTKWVVVGAALAVLGLIFLITGSSTGPNDFQALPVQQLVANVSWTLVTMLIPVSIGFAVLRYRLWDVDVLINRTLVYGSLTLSLGTLYLLSVIAMQSLARSLTGQKSDIGIAVVTLVVAALFNPWRRTVQRFIDRRFYRRKYDASRTLASFTSRLRDEVDLDILAGDLASVVNDTVQPASVSLWLRRPGEMA